MENKEIVAKTNSITQYAQKMAITNAETYVAGNEMLKSIKGLAREVKGSFDPIIEKAHAAHKEAIAQKNKHLQPLEDAEKLLKEKVTKYFVARETERIEEEEKLRKAAALKEAKLKEKAEAEKAKADKIRLEEQAKAEAEEKKRQEEQERQEELKRKAEAASIIKKEKILQQALEEKLIATRRQEEEEARASESLRQAMKADSKSEALEEKAENIEPVKLASTVKAIKGVSFKAIWDFKIIDIMKVPRQFLMVNEKAIRAYVQNTKGEHPIAGVSIFKSTRPAVRGN